MSDPVRTLNIRRAIAKKLALRVGVAAVVLGIGLMATLVVFERRAVERAAADQVGLLADAVATTFLVVDERNRTHRPEAVLAQVGAAPHVAFVDVLDSTGTVTKSTRPANVGTVPGLATNLRDVTLTDELIQVKSNMRWTQSCVGCHAAKQDPVGAVHIAISREATLRSIERFHVAGGVGVFVVFAILVLLVLFITERMVTRPIFRIAAVMQRASEGDFLVRARHFADDEFGALVRAFNTMLRNITALKATEIEREADLQRAREELTLQSQLAQTNAALERRVRAQSLLMEAAHRLASTLDNDAVLDRLAQAVRETLEHKDFAIFLVEDPDGGDAVLRAVRTAGAAMDTDALDGNHLIGQHIVGHVADTGAPLLMNDVQKPEVDGPETGALGKGSLLAVPMLHKGRVVGVMVYFHPETAHFDDEHVTLLQALAAQAAMAVVNADLHQRTVELSVTDALTGLMNRRALERRLELELIRAQRFGLPLCILMIDVDFFKKFNDRMGHLLGDTALVAVARALDGAVRKVDAVARFGGEEFCVFLPRTDIEAGVDVAEKLGDAVRELDVQGAKSQPLGYLSISIGLAMFPDDMPPAYEGTLSKVLLDRADRAVYEAKHKGRDQVVTATSIFGAEAPRPAAAVESALELDAVSPEKRHTADTRDTKEGSHADET